MTALVPVPTGPAGPAPTGPAGPRPGGPAAPPSGPKLADVDQLAEIDDLLVAALARATLLPESADRVEESGQVILAFRLELARRAVADLVRYAQSPVRQHRAGRPPASGADFLLPPVPALPSFDNEPAFSIGTAWL